MALGTPTERANFSSGTDGTLYTISSFTPPADSLLLLFVASGHATAATEPTIGGTMGLTWTKIAGQTTTAGTIRGTLWRSATTGSPPTGTITLTHGTTHSWCMGFVDSITGADTTTPIVQSGTPFQTTTTDNPGITLTNAIGSGNLTMGFNAWNRTFVLPVGSGYTQVNTVTTQATPTGIASAEYKMAGAQLVDWTTTDDIQKILFAIEVGALASANGTVTAVIATATCTALAPGVTSTPPAVVAPAATASGVALPPSVAGNAGVTGVLATATGTALPPAVSATRNPVVMAVSSTATATALAPAVTATQNPTVVVPVAAASGVLLPPGVSAGGSVSVSTPPSVATAAMVVPGVSATQNQTVAAVVATATSAARAPVVTGTSSPTVTSPIAVASAVALAPTVTATSSVTAPVATASAAARAPGISTGVTIAAPTATATAAALGPLIRADAVVLAARAEAQAAMLLPGVTGAVPGTPVDHPALTITTTTAQATLAAEVGTMTVAILTRVLTVEASEADVALTTAPPILELTGTS